MCIFRQERLPEYGKCLREGIEMTETKQEKEVYVLGLWECFGERSICGVYTSKVKLLKDYHRMMEGKEVCYPFSDQPREPVIYRFRANEFIGGTPEWNDGKLYLPDDEYEISIQELEDTLMEDEDGTE